MILCPLCKTPMEYIAEDNFYRCPTDQWTLWPDEKKVCCPGCHLPMIKNEDIGFYYCTICNVEVWPPEEEEEEYGIWKGQKSNAPVEARRNVYAGAYSGPASNAVKAGNKSGGRKAKKKPKVGRFGDKYADI